MIEISISGELADAQPGFMAHCADRGHAISVFDRDGYQARSREVSGSATDLAHEDDAEASTGGRTPRGENPTA
jgi:hypothetical protein